MSAGTVPASNYTTTFVSLGVMQGFGLGSVDLDTNPTRTVIIRNTEEEVASHQLMQITFIP